MNTNITVFLEKHGDIKDTTQDSTGLKTYGQDFFGELVLLLCMLLLKKFSFLQKVIMSMKMNTIEKIESF